MFDDDFDPEMHTPEEIEAYEAEQQRLVEAAQLLRSLNDLDDHQEALERLADEDPMGFVFSGQVHDGRTAEQADAWIEKRLYGETPK